MKGTEESDKPDEIYNQFSNKITLANHKIMSLYFPKQLLGPAITKFPRGARLAAIMTCKYFLDAFLRYGTRPWDRKGKGLEHACLHCNIEYYKRWSVLAGPMWNPGKSSNSLLYKICSSNMSTEKKESIFLHLLKDPRINIHKIGRKKRSLIYVLLINGMFNVVNELLKEHDILYYLDSETEKEFLKTHFNSAGHSRAVDFIVNECVKNVETKTQLFRIVNLSILSRSNKTELLIDFIHSEDHNLDIDDIYEGLHSSVKNEHFEIIMNWIKETTYNTLLYTISNNEELLYRILHYCTKNNKKHLINISILRETVIEMAGQGIYPSKTILFEYLDMRQTLTAYVNIAIREYRPINFGLFYDVPDEELLYLLDYACFNCRKGNRIIGDLIRTPVLFQYFTVNHLATFSLKANKLNRPELASVFDDLTILKFSGKYPVINLATLHVRY